MRLGRFFNLEPRSFFGSRLPADRFFERLQQVIPSNVNLDPNDFDNVTIRIIK
jgi:hypothetical protein